MNITIFIGNGFDKALGKKTGYHDFYCWLKKQPPSDIPFIEEMKKNISDDSDKWSDFEVGLGNFTEKIKDSGDAQNTLDNAIAWKREVDRLLIEYLKGEENSDNVKNIVDSVRDIQELWDYLSSAMVFINIGYNIFINDRRNNIRFISLNYTDFLDQIVKKLSEYQANNSLIKIHGDVSHPHGELSSQIILGVNDSFEFKYRDFIGQDNWEFESSILKQSNIENNMGRYCERRCESFINESMVICIYGASLGQTDEYWWKKLAVWLQKDKKHRLIIFWYLSGNKSDIEKLTSDIQNVFINQLPFTEEPKDELKKRILVYFHKREFIFSSHMQQRKVFSLGNGIELPMILVEAGSFTMSKKDGENEACEKEHVAYLKKNFYIGETLVTQEQYIAITGKNPSHFNFGKKLPVEQVSWYEAMDFCAKLNEKSLAPSGYHFTLPTETQWEYAARGGKVSKGYKFSGSDNVDEVAWHDKNSDRKTHEVKMKKPNELGIYDMSGNVWEWCLDDYTDDSSKAKPEFVRQNNDETLAPKVDRGGAWDYKARVALRSNYAPKGQRLTIGFRVALVPNQY